MSEKIYLTKEQQVWLMYMLEIDNPSLAVEEFSKLMIKEHADPLEMQKYIVKIMRKTK